MEPARQRMPNRIVMPEAKLNTNLPDASPSCSDEPGTDASCVGEGQAETVRGVVECSGVSKPAAPMPSSVHCEEQTAELIVDKRMLHIIRRA
jgi:hypothetical protein